MLVLLLLRFDFFTFLLLLNDVWFFSLFDRYFSFFFSKKERCILSELVHFFLGLVEVAQIEESCCFGMRE